MSASTLLRIFMSLAGQRVERIPTPARTSTSKRFASRRRKMAYSGTQRHFRTEFDNSSLFYKFRARRAGSSP